MKTKITAFFILAVILIFAGCTGDSDDATINHSYTVTYNGNGFTGGNVPVDSANYKNGQTVTILSNPGGLTKTGFFFTGWNTKEDGTGTTYTQGQTFTMGTSDITLYARWTTGPVFTVTYHGNGQDGGSEPVDTTNYEEDQLVTIAGNSGNLKKTGHSFAGWNTAANGTGTTYPQGKIFVMGTSDVTLYAVWWEGTEGLEYTLINGGTEYSVTKGTADTSGNVIIPEYWDGRKVTALGAEAFYQCHTMTSIAIPNTVTIIGPMAFEDCSSLASITIPDSVTTIYAFAFRECTSLTSVAIPNSVTTIGDGAFMWCEIIESVTMPDSVTTIGKGTFSYCFSLESIIIPQSVTTIGSSAFVATGLKSVTIPDLVNSIGNHAFRYCVELSTVNVNATTPPVLGGDAVFDDNKVGRIIYVPGASVGNYKSTGYWVEYADFIEAQP